MTDSESRRVVEAADRGRMLLADGRIVERERPYPSFASVLARAQRRGELRRLVVQCWKVRKD